MSFEEEDSNSSSSDGRSDREGEGASEEGGGGSDEESDEDLTAQNPYVALLECAGGCDQLKVMGKEVGLLGTTVQDNNQLHTEREATTLGAGPAVPGEKKVREVSATPGL